MDEKTAAAKIREAAVKGNIRCTPRVERALSNVDLRNPDFTIVEVELHGWGAWEREKDGQKFGNLGGFAIDWVAKSAGCGTMSVYIDKEDGKIHCQNEYMGKQFLKDVLCKLVDEMILDDTKENDDKVQSRKDAPEGSN